jgi:hypothetical protein
MNAFIGEIYYNLCNDRGTSIDRWLCDGCTVTRCSINSCLLSRECAIIFADSNIPGDESPKSVLSVFIRCRNCTGIFTSLLPSVDTFLQRRALTGVFATDDSVADCLFCFRRKNRATNMSALCTKCRRVHNQEEGELIEKRMIMGEVLGADCAGVVTGYLPYFFGGRVAQQN